MTVAETTSWRVIQGAAEGNQELRDEFARRYAPIMEAYLAARWRRTPLAESVKDALQEAFVECFRPGGVLESAQPGKGSGFRAFLFGVLRNVALRVEQRRQRDERQAPPAGSALEAVIDPRDSASVVFDREWARGLMREAAQRQAAQAAALDEAARRRVELLRLRFEERLPMREIVQLWQVDPDVLEREYAKARHEFEAALRGVVIDHHPGSAEEIDATLREIIRALGR